MIETDDEMPSYRPGAFYYRRDIRTARTLKKCKDIALDLIAEHERLRAWVREQGMVPPKWTVPPDEAKEKGWETCA